MPRPVVRARELCRIAGSNAIGGGKGRENMRVLAMALFLIAWVGNASAFPTRQVLLVVPFAAGGSNDIMARVLGERLQREWRQSVVVENQTGAAGSIGAEDRSECEGGEAAALIIGCLYVSHTQPTGSTVNHRTRGVERLRTLRACQYPIERASLSRSIRRRTCFV